MCMTIDTGKIDFQKRAVRGKIDKTSRTRFQRQTKEDIVRLTDSRIVDAGFYMSSCRVEGSTLSTLGTLREHRHPTNDLPCRSDS